MEAIISNSVTFITVEMQNYEYLSEKKQSIYYVVSSEEVNQMPFDDLAPTCATVLINANLLYTVLKL